MDTQTPPPSQATAPAANPVSIRRVGALAPGFRFHPTDDELVCYYLKRKVYEKQFCFNAIAEVEIYKIEPWDLPEKSSVKTRDEEWYFYSPLNKKSGNSAKMNRSTERGYWKPTGKDREIRYNNQLVGMKKTLVFYNGRAPSGKRTNWVMYEYQLVYDDSQKAGTSEMKAGYVLCKVFRKEKKGPPSQNCYAPFAEEEWDDEEIVVPDTTEEARLDDNDEAAEIGTEKGIHLTKQQQQPFSANEMLTEDQNALILSEEWETACPAEVTLTANPLFPSIHFKRRLNNDGTSCSNGSESSPSSSAMTTETTKMTWTTNAATIPVVSTRLELSLPQPNAPRKSTPVLPSTPDAAAYLQSTVPPSCMKLLSDLRSEIEKTSAERETLKLELMNAEAMINALQSRINWLSEENAELKKSSSVDH